MTKELLGISAVQRGMSANKLATARSADSMANVLGTALGGRIYIGWSNEQPSESGNTAKPQVVSPYSEELFREIHGRVDLRQRCSVLMCLTGWGVAICACDLVWRDSARISAERGEAVK